MLQPLRFEAYVKLRGIEGYVRVLQLLANSVRDKEYSAVAAVNRLRNGKYLLAVRYSPETAAPVGAGAGGSAGAGAGAGTSAGGDSERKEADPSPSRPAPPPPPPALEWVSPAEVYSNDDSVLATVLKPRVAPPYPHFKTMYELLGARWLSTVVKREPVLVGSSRTTPLAESLKFRIASRAPLIVNDNRGARWPTVNSGAEQWLKVSVCMRCIRVPTWSPSSSAQRCGLQSLVVRV